MNTVRGREKHQSYLCKQRSSASLVTTGCCWSKRIKRHMPLDRLGHSACYEQGALTNKQSIDLEDTSAKNVSPLQMVYSWPL